MAHTYSLGAVKPWVRSAAYEVGNRFDVSTIYGVGVRPDKTSDHPGGYATDFMVYKDRSKGDAIAAYCHANWARLRIKYIIWFDREDDGNGWYAYGNHGSVTLNHEDHVHVSYDHSGTGTPYAGQSTDSTTQDTGGGLSDAVTTLTSAQTWIRVLEFIAGLALIAYAVRSMVNAFI